jgi:hypothetical protein
VAQRQPPEHRTGNDLLMFYGWPQQNRPDLLKHRGDPFQQLKIDLSDEWQD